MQPLPKDSTPEQRTELALQIAQHAHLKHCDFCSQALAEITPDVTQPWARQTLNALAHRCEQHDQVEAAVRGTQDPDTVVTSSPADTEGGNE